MNRTMNIDLRWQLILGWSSWAGLRGAHLLGASRQPSSCFGATRSGTFYQKSKGPPLLTSQSHSSSFDTLHDLLAFIEPTRVEMLSPLRFEGLLHCIEPTDHRLPLEFTFAKILIPHVLKALVLCLHRDSFEIDVVFALWSISSSATCRSIWGQCLSACHYRHRRW